MENDELFEKLYDIFTENYKDKINKNKDLQDYLQEKTKNELVGEYLFYETAANEGNKEIEELKKERKDKIIKLISDNNWDAGEYCIRPVVIVDSNVTTEQMPILPEQEEPVRD